MYGSGLHLLEKVSGRINMELLTVAVFFGGRCGIMVGEKTIFTLYKTFRSFYHGLNYLIKNINLKTIH